MWAVAVVCWTKTRRTRSRWRRLKMRSQSRHSERAVRTKRSAIAFALGDRIGVLMISMPSLRKTVSKSRVKLLSRSRIRKRTGVARSGKVQASWRQRRRTDDERAPARSRQQTARGSEENPIGRAQRGPGELASQHRELVAEHNDLELLELIRAEPQPRAAEGAGARGSKATRTKGAAPPRGRDGRPTLRTRTGATDAEPS